LSEEDPTERIVSFGAARLDRDDFLEVSLRSREVALLQRTNPLPIQFVCLLRRILRWSTKRHCERGRKNGGGNYGATKREVVETNHLKIVTRKVDSAAAQSLAN
jgi:hypothetical protein